MSATSEKEKIQNAQKTPECIESVVKKSLEENNNNKLDVSCIDDGCVSIYLYACFINIGEPWCLLCNYTYIIIYLTLMYIYIYIHSLII